MVTASTKKKLKKKVNVTGPQSSFFTQWRDRYQDRSEWFTLGENEWCIDRAKAILRLNPRKHHSIRVRDWKGFADAMLTLKPLGTKIDLNVPVICIPLGNGYFPIDGWTRIRKALAEGVPFLKCVRLSMAEAKTTEKNYQPPPPKKGSHKPTIQKPAEPTRGRGI